MTADEATACAERFWSLVGRRESFPRSLESSVAWALPLAVVKLPRLGLDRLRQWLLTRRIPCSLSGSDRPLRAFLVASAGRGLVFLDGTDVESERRFSLAHEVAHFLIDYLHPRELALATLGLQVRDVLDGLRPPTPEERLAGVLRGVPIGIFTHLVERSARGDVLCAQVRDAEDRADRFALELLAPRSAVLQRLKSRGVSLHEKSAIEAVLRLLVSEFGLPPAMAERYGRVLLTSYRAARTFREWLGS